MQAELVSVIATSSDSTPSTTAPPVAISTTSYISEMYSAQPITPATTMAYSISGPPPLIPSETFSIDSQHRPTASTLFAPHSINSLPINTQQQVLSNSLINTSTVFTSNASPSFVSQHSFATSVLLSQSVVPSHQSDTFHQPSPYTEKIFLIS